jgi:hypothetical protein
MNRGREGVGLVVIIPGFERIMEGCGRGPVVIGRLIRRFPEMGLIPTMAPTVLAIRLVRDWKRRSILRILPIFFGALCL